MMHEGGLERERRMGTVERLAEGRAGGQMDGRMLERLGEGLTEWIDERRGGESGKIRCGGGTGWMDGSFQSMDIDGWMESGVRSKNGR